MIINPNGYSKEINMNNESRSKEETEGREWLDGMLPRPKDPHDGGGGTHGRGIGLGIGLGKGPIGPFQGD